ncbi:mediator of RNA polymerase II transcription subunit 28-like [Acropora millepora]|uniref:mediator of RNA polymerase II transcription subunit 28-like n=1 Tax=Acropora millepora TaxID=45264 RepID=UPI001CF4DC05|nr:mediator of RNA polymerase II transcription subunit 28-like [Acropora millepora]
MAAYREDLVTALESSLQACVSLFLATENVEKGREMDNANTHGVEANIKRFLEAAKMLEADFLRKQMYSRVNHPEEVTKEEVEKMRAELAQKDELLTKTRDRITVWTNALQELETKQTRLHLADMVPQRPASMDSTR